MGDRLHGFGVNCSDAADGVLHDDVEHAFAIANTLLGCAAEIDGAEDGAVFRVDDCGVFGGMAEDVDAFVERIEVDAVGPRAPTSMLLISVDVLVSNMEILG